MSIARTIDSSTSNVSKARLQRAMCLHRNICNDLNPNGFGLQEVLDELANPEGNFCLGNETGDKVEVLMRVLEDREYIEKIDENSFRILREIEEDQEEESGTVD